MDWQHANWHITRWHQSQFLLQLKHDARAGGQEDIAFRKEKAHGSGEGGTDFIDDASHLVAVDGGLNAHIYVAA